MGRKFVMSKAASKDSIKMILIILSVSNTNSDRLSIQFILLLLIHILIVSYFISWTTC
jgi:hypothetical protein